MEIFYSQASACFSEALGGGIAFLISIRLHTNAFKLSLGILHCFFANLDGGENS